MVEAVRNTNAILDKINAAKDEQEKKKAANKQKVDTEVFGEIEEIQLGREQLSQIIAKNSEKELEDFGISLIDVQLRRISYEKSVERKVYERMISERQRVAEKIRSIGNGEKAKIEGRLSRDLQEIESKAYQKAQVIKGRGQADSITIYAKALSPNPKFYEFLKTLEVYEEVLNEKTKLLLTSDSDFLKLLKKASK